MHNRSQHREKLRNPKGVFFFEKILWMSSQKCLVLSPFLHVSPTTTPPTAPTKKNDDNDDDDDNDASVTV